MHIVPIGDQMTVGDAIGPCALWHQKHLKAQFHKLLWMYIFCWCVVWIQVWLWNGAHITTSNMLCRCIEFEMCNSVHAKFLRV
jgi:hypothetical protein